MQCFFLVYVTTMEINIIWKTHSLDAKLVAALKNKILFLYYRINYAFIKLKVQIVGKKNKKTWVVHTFKFNQYIHQGTRVGSHYRSKVTLIRKTLHTFLFRSFCLLQLLLWILKSTGSSSLLHVIFLFGLKKKSLTDLLLIT